MSSTDRDNNAKRSSSRTRTSRPTTPLRPSSRSSFRNSARNSVSGDAEFPLNTFEPAFAELSDSMADLENNMMHFQLMHESLARFSESFASFLYGLNMNAFCVDFPEGPVAESFKRMRLQAQDELASSGRDRANEMDGETTFMTTDTSFVDNPPISSKPTPKFATPKAKTSRVPAPSVTTNTRGGSTRGGRGGARGGARPSRLAQPRGRGGLRGVP
ncbi:DASH complex subunit Dam1-domain-containing protein [Coniochaeta sp. 2T2.1]|nr:DASH complex subunit Dam1-domain-containing protein [Coniochaeta sp. 2T2.1]